MSDKLFLIIQLPIINMVEIPDYDIYKAMVEYCNEKDLHIPRNYSLESLILYYDDEFQKWLYNDKKRINRYLIDDDIKETILATINIFVELRAETI